MQYKYAQIYGTNMVYKLEGLSKVELSISKLGRPTLLTQKQFNLLENKELI